MRRHIPAVLLALAISSPAIAQSQSTIPLFKGSISPTNAEAFTTALANRVDTVVGIQVTVDPSDERSPEGYLVDAMSDAGGAYISVTEQQMGGVQINAPDAYWRHGSYVIDGFYVVKYGGMGQGIMGYQLRPTDEAAIRVSTVPIAEVDVNAIPNEVRERTAD